MQFAGLKFYVVCALGLTLSLSPQDSAGADSAGQDRRSIAVCILKSRGEFTSRDRPFGVDQSPRTSSIHLLSVHQGRLQKLVDTGGRAEHPRFSPDGKWLYFQSNDRGRWDIYRCRLDGSGQENLTSKHMLGRDSYGFEVAPLGDAIVFTSHDGQIARAAIMQSDGKQPRWIAPAMGHCYMAALSPSGDAVVLSHTADRYRIVWINLKSGARRLLTPQHDECFVPRFTPNGTSVVFVRRDGDIYRADLDDGAVHRLTSGSDHYMIRLGKQDQHGSTDGPDIAPRGSKLAYVAHREGLDSIWTMSIAGRDHRQITGPQAACGRVQWSPDGTCISFVSFVEKRPQLFLVDIKTRTQRQLTTVDGAVFETCWFPRQPSGLHVNQGSSGND